MTIVIDVGVDEVEVKKLVTYNTYDSDCAT